MFFVELQNRDLSREGSKVRLKDFSIATNLDDVELPAFGGQTAGKLRDKKRLALCRGPSFRSFTAGPLLPTFGSWKFQFYGPSTLSFSFKRRHAIKGLLAEPCFAGTAEASSLWSCSPDGHHRRSFSSRGERGRASRKHWTGKGKRLHADFFVGG